MNILKIDHIGIAVKNTELSKSFWSEIMGVPCVGNETIKEQKVKTSFFPIGESEIELLESTEENGPIAKYINKKGEGIQHIAFRVENIDTALMELKKKKIILIDEKPRIGAGGSRIAFIHPKSTNGILVEICEK